MATTTLLKYLQRQFENKLVVDDRIPIYQYTYSENHTYILLPPKLEFYHQLILVRLLFYILVYFDFSFGFFVDHFLHALWNKPFIYISVFPCALQ
jgi:hypothetical protein